MRTENLIIALKIATQISTSEECRFQSIQSTELMKSPGASSTNTKNQQIIQSKNKLFCINA